jgi:phosphatidate cytidylyltransferase
MLKHRVISGFLMGGASLAILFFAPAGLSLLILIAISALAQIEFYVLIGHAKVPVHKTLGTVCGCLLIAVTFATLGFNVDPAHAHGWEAIVAAFCFLAVCARQLPERESKTPLETISYTLLGILYIGFLLSFIARLGFAWDFDGLTHRISDTGQNLVLYLILTVKFSDIGAYFVGSRFGKHKLSPRISPKKTWEGLAGGVVTSVAASLVTLWILGGALGSISVSLTHAIILPVLLTLVGVTGDIVESLFKRAAGQKDSSSTIPGMGGLLDVLDSLLFCAPVLYAYTLFFLI